MRSIGIAWLGALALAAVVAGSTVQDQRKQYEADVHKTILELQQFRQSSSAPITSGSGREGVATLVNLNPAIDAWYLLRIAWKDGAAEPAAHLEIAKPHEAHLVLDERYRAGIVVQSGNDRHPCELFGSGSGSGGALEEARRSKLAYVPLCEGRVYLRNPVEGHTTTLESAVDFLRDRVWGGEQVITVFHHLLADRYRETGEPGTRAAAGPRPMAGGTPAGRPLAALIDPQYADRLVIPRGMGIVLHAARAGKGRHDSWRVVRRRKCRNLGEHHPAGRHRTVHPAKLRDHRQYSRQGRGRLALLSDRFRPRPLRTGL